MASNSFQRWVGQRDGFESQLMISTCTREDHYVRDLIGDRKYEWRLYSVHSYYVRWSQVIMLTVVLPTP